MNTHFEPVQTVPMVGGVLCLDFANTTSLRGTPEPRERLLGYEEVLVWSERDGLVDGSRARELREEAARHRVRAATVHARALELREAIYRIFSATARGEAGRAEDLDVLNGTLVDALPRRRIAPAGGDYVWSWDAPADALEWPLWPIALSAAELLASPERARVKECTNAKCGWLFLDVSRNRSRRWCDMRDCGNRAKARRHYARKRRSTA